MLIKPRAIIRGLLSYIVPDNLRLRKGTGGSSSTEYCYSVWLRHLVHLYKNNLISDASEIKRIAEIGPGDSLGIGIAALLSCASEYYAFDIIEHTALNKNKRYVDDVYILLKNRTNIPNGDNYTNVNPKLDNYEFPKDVLKDLSDLDYRRNEILSVINGSTNSKFRIKYLVPWNKFDFNLKGKMDLIYSQAVMEHVPDIKTAYSIMYEWLKPGGIISHQIDLKAHEISNHWNGHRYINDIVWKILMHGRKYIINRYPLSSHIDAITAAGFKIKNILTVSAVNSHPKEKIKVKNIKYNNEDLTVASVLIQAQKT